MLNSHSIKFLLGKQTDYYDRLKFHIFAWPGLNPDYAPDFNLLRSKLPHQNLNFKANHTLLIKYTKKLT